MPSKCLIVTDMLLWLVKNLTQSLEEKYQNWDAEATLFDHSLVSSLLRKRIGSLNRFKSYYKLNILC